MNVFADLPNEVKSYILSYLNKKCFRCNKILYYLKNDKSYKFYPPFLNNDREFKGYDICALCLFSMQMVSRFTNKRGYIL